jgi:hypothetical protein
MLFYFKKSGILEACLTSWINYIILSIMLRVSKYIRHVLFVNFYHFMLGFLLRPRTNSCTRATISETMPFPISECYKAPHDAGRATTHTALVLALLWLCISL